MSEAIFNKIIKAMHNGQSVYKQMDEIERLAREGIERSQYNMLREFQEIFGHAVEDKPTMMGRNAMDEMRGVVIDRLRSELEILKEFNREFGTGGQVFFRASLMLEELIEFMSAETLLEQVDALVDMHYINTGNFVEIGTDPQPVFEIVHQANMGKLWDDGKPHYDENGKVVKPPDWKEKHAPEPKLHKEIFRQRGVDE